MQRIIEWWNNISFREQVMLALALFFGLSALFYFFAYQPITQAYQQSQQRLELSYQDYRWLQKQRQTIESLRNKSRGALPALLTLGQLEKTVRKQLKEKEIEARIKVIDSVNDQNAGSLKIELSGNAVTVMQWLEAMVNSGHKIDVINLENKDNWLSGLVSVKT